MSTRLTPTEVEAAQSKFRASCAPFFEQYQNVLNTSVFACKSAMLAAIEAGDGFDTQPTRNACIVNVKRVDYMSDLESNCISHSVIDSHIGARIVVYRLYEKPEIMVQLNMLDSMKPKF
jgi:hypothetical protein